MELDATKLLQENPLLLTFWIIGLGYLVGRIRLGPVEFGPTTGVLLMGLLFGHLGFPTTSGAASFGFTIFIFSVGLQAGPSFFGVFMQDGPKYIALSAVAAATAVSLTLGISTYFDLEVGLGAGLLAGALTSTPTLAGAEDAIRSGLAVLPAGMTQSEAAANVSAAYALTYIFGTAGLIMFVQFFPRMAGIDLAEEARRLGEERGMGKKPNRVSGDVPVVRAYRVSGTEAVGKRLGDIGAERGHKVVALKIRRGERVLDRDPDMVFEDGDIVSVIAGLNEHHEFQQLAGKEVLDPTLLSYQVKSTGVIVLNQKFLGQKIRDLAIATQYGCFVTGVSRAGIELTYQDDLRLQKGDRLQVTGVDAALQQFAEACGYIEEDVEKTDLLTFSLGICGGILLGLVVLKLGQISIGLGSAGGLLMVGILIGFLSSIHPTFGRVPAAARFLLMELGLTIFMCSVGLRAGGGLAEILFNAGPQLVLGGVAVTLLPVLVSYGFGRTVLKMNPALLLGSIAGAMTSTPSLSVITGAAKSEVPALGYAGTYTFANVFLTFSGATLMVI